MNFSKLYPIRYKDMDILLVGLVYGNRPHNIILDNLSRAGFSFDYTTVNTEGIANALNDGLDVAIDGRYDAIGYLANDIIEPYNWLLKKVEALTTYPKAGIVASSLDESRRGIKSEHLISNWLVSMDVVDKIGIFNESMFPYGPIDLDYCERANLAGFYTYYVMDCLAKHEGTPSTGDEYGYNKADIITQNWDSHVKDLQGYRNGTKNINHGKRTRNKGL